MSRSQGLDVFGLCISLPIFFSISFKTIISFLGFKDVEIIIAAFKNQLTLVMPTGSVT